jgi:hypothetical protein
MQVLKFLPRMERSCPEFEVSLYPDALFLFLGLNPLIQRNHHI